MNKFYTCHFESVQVGKKVLKDLTFASLDKQKWIEITSNNLSISDYDKVKSLFAPPKLKDDGTYTSANITIDAIVIWDLADKTKKPLNIREIY